jgi:hypothetical protein
MKFSQLKPEEVRRRANQRAASIGACFDARLGWRIKEWTALTGTSRPTFWRQVKAGQIKVVYIGGIPIVPRSEAIRLGLIQS